jgi:2-phosphoglycerate kinase
VSIAVPVPTSHPIAVDLHEVKEARAQRIILDVVKDHLIPHLVEKQTAKEMWDALKKLYEAKNENMKMTLKDKLHSTKMVKGESVTSYLTRVARVKDELAAIGEVILDSELVRVIHQFALAELKMSRQRLSRQMLRSQSSEFSRSFKRPPFSAFPSL